MLNNMPFTRLYCMRIPTAFSITSEFICRFLWVHTIRVQIAKAISRPRIWAYAAWLLMFALALRTFMHDAVLLCEKNLLLFSKFCPNMGNQINSKI